MVSILEQYEIDAGRSNEVNNFLDIQNQLHSAFAQTSLNPTETSQIFEKQYFKLEFKSAIRQVEKCNDTILVLFDQKKINRIKENQINEILEAPDRVSNMFLDPTGTHLLVATENLELHYFLKSSKKFKPISKFKGHLVTAVGWNSNSTEATTDSILIGTKKGLLFEICINIGNEGVIFNQSVDNLCKQVYDFGDDATIHGIQIFQKVVDSLQNEIFDILVATTKRLFEFTGITGKVGNETSPQQPFKFAHVLSLFQKQHEKLANFTEMAVGSLTYSRLVTTSNQNKIPKVAWMTGGGVLVADIDFKVLAKFNNPNINSIGINDVKCLINEQTRNIIVYPQEKLKKKSSEMDELPIPISVALTEHHILIMFEKSIKILCLLSGDLISNEKIDIANSKLISFWQNPLVAKYELGYFTDKSIFKYKITKETRNLWKFYLKKGEFEMAKKYCQDSVILLNEVTVRQADSLFENKKYIESAEIYATTETSFEEIALKFLDAQDMTALRTFLTKKFQTLRSPLEITQITLIVSWIIEIFLNQLEDLTEQKSFDAFSTLHKEFRKFLESNKIKECLYESKEAIYEIFSGHGNMDDLIYFAEIMKDYEKIIGYYIQNENYLKALQALVKQTKPEFYYKYSPILMQHVPKELIDMWIQLGNKLDANKLLPSLTIGRETIEQANEAIRYLEFCINKQDSKQIALHNYLISLYVKYKPDELLDYIKCQGEDETLINYDKHYALRLCLNNCDNNSIKESCVYIYKLIGLFEEAVDLALSIDVKLAKDIADSTELNINDELKQKLWLRIARHIIEDEKDVSKAMSFLDECGDSVQIEDILPYFPDFVTIDDFKDAIKESLTSYTYRIDTLKGDIELAATSAESIRNEIHQIRSKSISISSSERCLICHYPLLTRSFYVFPCAHKFHSDCLYHAMMPYLLPSKRKMIEELQKALHDVTNSNFGIQQQQQQKQSSYSASNIVGTVADAFNTKLFTKSKLGIAQNQAQQQQQVTNTYNAQEIESLKNELDDLLASECIYCGDNLIKTIDEPFFNLNEYEEIFKSWL